VLWHVQHGATAKQYRDQCIERGVPVPGYLIPPAPLPGIEGWFTAFWELRTERRFPEGPIPATAIREYPVAPEEAEDFATAMRRADAALIEFLNKPEDQRRSLPPMLPPKRPK
jgi:hypothetical protein